jgi:hypothetical protein
MMLLRVLPISFALILLSTTIGLGQITPQDGEGTSQLLAQNFRAFNPDQPREDPDLEDDESLEDLMKIEYDKDAWSMGTAIGLSLVPGGGFGLLYTRKKPQAVIPFLLSTVGYGLGIAYMAGAFDESQSSICTHAAAGRVAPIECTYADIPNDPTLPPRTDNQTIDPRTCADPNNCANDPNAKPYFQTGGNYTRSTAGRDYSGRTTGLTILAATYVVSSTLGAVWSGMSVRSHNKQLRRDIESTADRNNLRRPSTQTVELSPTLEVNSARTTFGVKLSF